MKKHLILFFMVVAPWCLSAQTPTLSIASGATITLDVGALLSVGTAAASGTITNANTTPGAGLVIKSSSSGSGSLIAAGTPNATVQCYVKANRWNMVSPSTTGVTAQTFSSASGTDSWLTWFDETVGTNGGSAGQGWTYMISLSAAVNVGQGYVYYPSANETVAYKGNLQSADFSPAITWSGSTHGFNAVGNPFSSALQWNTNTSWVISGHLKPIDF
jgi:hypothetical protein